MDHNALWSWHATMYKFNTSMVCCSLGMQQCAIHNAKIQKTTFSELGVQSCTVRRSISNLLIPPEDTNYIVLLVINIE